MIRRILAVVAAILVSTTSTANTSGDVSNTDPLDNVMVTEVTMDIPKVITTEPTEENVTKETEPQESATQKATEQKEKVEPTTEKLTGEPTEEESEWQGQKLTPSLGTVEGPSGKETYYNLDMSGVISIMQNLGYDYEYYIREDGVKMIGPYIMCAANLDLRPRGTVLETTLGKAIVCDTGEFAYSNPTQVDIAVSW